VILNLDETVCSIWPGRFPNFALPLDGEISNRFPIE